VVFALSARAQTKAEGERKKEKASHRKVRIKKDELGTDKEEKEDLTE
jgi:hypothetical protein